MQHAAKKYLCLLCSHNQEFCFVFQPSHKIVDFKTASKKTQIENYAHEITNYKYTIWREREKEEKKSLQSTSNERNDCCTVFRLHFQIIAIEV